jgi:GNAT superfamily N-acetyltransferase
MPEVRELDVGETARGARALLELRPHLLSAEALVDVIDRVQRPQGYRLIGSFDHGAGDAAAVAGFRTADMLAYGHHLYVDDLVTRPDARGRGHADALFAWLGDEAERLGCEALRLDSGLGPERADAHRFYFRHRLRIASFSFARPVERRR